MGNQVNTRNGQEWSASLSPDGKYIFFMSARIPDEELEKVMHISLPISKETILMGSDSSDSFGRATVAGNNFTISINIKYN